MVTIEPVSVAPGTAELALVAGLCLCLWAVNREKARTTRALEQVRGAEAEGNLRLARQAAEAARRDLSLTGAALRDLARMQARNAAGASRAPITAPSAPT